MMLLWVQKNSKLSYTLPNNILSNNISAALLEAVLAICVRCKIIIWMSILSAIKQFTSSSLRERYLGDALRNHTTHELLCGKPEFTNDENVSLFLKVQDFII